MRLTQFPDIQWLRKQAENNFQDGIGVNNRSLGQKGWPSVVLNTTSFGAERNSIKGPYSLFLNLSGDSLVKVDHKTVALTTDNLCVMNSGQYYDLIIPEGSRTDTFNVHFGEHLFNDVLAFHNSSTYQLLEDPLKALHTPPEESTKSTWKSDLIHEKVMALNQFYQGRDTEEAIEYELLADLLLAVLSNGERERINANALDGLKLSTKQELLARVSLSVDYMHAHFRQAISLDELSSIACLSKYHYLRTFKSVYNCTPQQMIATLRLKKATYLLQKSNQPLSEIAPSLGFSELAAFTRFIKKMSGKSPSAIRKSS